jgi:hypothetical protein
VHAIPVEPHPRHTRLYGTPDTLDAPPLPDDQTIPGGAACVHPGALGSQAAPQLGVCWGKAKSSFQVQLMDPQTKRTRHIGYFASEEDAARAYDAAAVQAHGPGAERNFPGEAISELPVEKKQRSSSRYIGVCWSKRKSSWEVQLTHPQTQRRSRTGSYASEEDAARAYDRAAVEVHGPGAKRN